LIDAIYAVTTVFDHIDNFGKMPEGNLIPVEDGVLD
jgi:hypothetical protein